MSKEQAIFVRTKTGEEALADPVRLLQHGLRRVLALVDGRSTVFQLRARLRDDAYVMGSLRELLRLGLIQPAANFPGGSQITQDWFDLEESGEADAPGEASEGASKPKKTGLTPEERNRYLRPKPIGVVGYTSLILFGLVMCLMAVAQFFPYDRYHGIMEARLAASLHMPVKVDGVGFTLFPLPAIRINKLSIGPSQEFVLSAADIKPDNWLFLDGRKAEMELRVHSMEANLSDLYRLAALPGASGDWQLKRITIDTVNLKGEKLWVTGISAQIPFGAGGPQEISVRRGFDDLRLTLTPTGQGVLLKAAGTEWHLGTTAIRGLDLEVLINEGKLDVLRLDCTLLGGRIQGRGSLTPGGALSGSFDLKGLEAGSVLSAMDYEVLLKGELTGNFSLEGLPVFSLYPWDRLDMKGAWQMRRGEILRMDLTGALRVGNGMPVQGGNTLFEELQVNVSGQGSQWLFNSINLRAGSMLVDGEMQIKDGGKLEGGLTVKVSDRIRTPVVIEGRVKTPVLRGQRRG